MRRQLEQQFGDKIYTQGMKVYTTLDLDLQGAAERALDRQLRAVESGQYGAYPHRTYEQYLARASGSSSQEDNVVTRPTCRARSSRWIRATAPFAR